MSVRSKIAEWIAPQAAADRPTSLVPSEASYAELEALLASGLLSPGLSGVFDVSVAGGVAVPFQHPTLVRCLTLISGVSAQLVTGGGLSVVDRATRSAAAPPEGVMELLSVSPDGETPASVFVEQTMHDLLTTSNMLVRIERGVNGVPRKLIRQSMVDADVVVTRNGKVYRTRDWDGRSSVRDNSGYDMIHSMVGSLRPATSHGGGVYSGSWEYLATPLLTLLRPALEVGVLGEQFVRDFFKGGANSAPFVVLYEASLEKEKRAELQAYLASRKGRDPLIMGGTGAAPPTVVPMHPAPQRRDTLDLRQHQDREVARVYGLPGPLVGVDTSTWGAGIAALGKLGYRFGIKQWIDRWLAGMERALLPDGLAFRIDPTDVTRDDLSETSAAVATLIGGSQNPAVISREEARHLLGLSREVDGELVEYNPGNGEMSSPEDNREDS